MIQTVVGISFNPNSDQSIVVGTDVEITHDKDNKYSSRAIAVKRDGVLLGHIGEKNNVNHEKIFNELPLMGRVKTLARLEEGETFAKFKVGEITHLEIEFPHSSDLEDYTQSFNENEKVKFDKESHTYKARGKSLISATNYIKKWIKEFDAEGISGPFARSMGCSQEEVLGLWKESGDAAAVFGNSIHNALECYEKYKNLGSVIQMKKNLPFNKALPSHSVLREIVEAFYKQVLPDGEVETEVLVTNVELGLCGMIDRLLIVDREKKICRVQDYKVNADCQKEGETFLGQMATLPKNKLSKYQLQMSFYARLLELSGWTVQALDAYVYDGKWVAYEFPILKLDF